MNNLHLEANEAMPAIISLLKTQKGPISLESIIKGIPDHREDAVRMAFWSLSREGKIKVNKQFRASAA